MRLTRTLLAPSILAFSSSGLLMAWRAASTARLAPSPRPIPMMASPLPFMTVRTSAKSMLISPGSVISSEMPWTPCLRTSSAMRKACLMGVLFSATLRRYWLGMRIRVSTFLRSLSIPSFANWSFLRPSNANGVVTTATVRMLRPLASSATTGAAPVPVPPPIPAVMNTMSVPSRISRISSLLSSAAFIPISGIPPAPRPPVSSFPMGILTCAFDLCRACTSVFRATNVTFLSPLSIILFIAFPPPPPTPMTLMSVGGVCSS